MKVRKRSLIAILLLFFLLSNSAGSALAAAKTTTAGPGTATAARAITDIPQASPVSMNLGDLSNIIHPLTLWLIVTVASLLIFMWAILSHKSTPWWLSLMWCMSTGVFGPLALLAYLPSIQSSRQTQRSGDTLAEWQRALGATIFSATGNAVGFVLLIAFYLRFATTINPGPALLVVPFLISWLIFWSPLTAFSTMKGYLDGVRQTLPVTIISTVLTMVSAVLLTNATINTWFPGIWPDNPWFWFCFIIGLMVGSTIAYPFHHWLVANGGVPWPRQKSNWITLYADPVTEELTPMKKLLNIENPSSTRPRQTRLPSLDQLRGLIIIVMALDHANSFVAQKHSSGEHWGGKFPVYEDTLSFLTRLVTHPAAPGFMFLMGTGMLLFAHSRRKQGWSEWVIIRHFLTRGAFLIALQLLLINFAWSLGPESFPTIYIGVLVALGGGMIIGSLLLRLKPVYLLTLTGILFVGTEILHPHPSQWGQIFDMPLGLLFGYSGGDMSFWSNYPILPWLELVVFGMVFGHWLLRDAQKAFNRALQLGVVFLLAFVAIRYLDGFGNIRPRQGDSWIDFLNVVKYPPSMTFTLLTMGVNLIILGLLSKAKPLSQQFLQPLAVFGQAPLFFYILHLFLYAMIGRWFAPEGTTIPTMYPYWLLGTLILYPLCRWFGSFKHRQPANSVLRFL